MFRIYVALLLEVGGLGKRWVPFVFGAWGFLRSLHRASVVVVCH